MSEAGNSVDMRRLVVLLCGPDGPTQGAVERLRYYEEQGIVKPEIRRCPLLVSPYFSVYKFDGSNLTGGRSSRVRPHDAFFEGLRSAGLPPIRPVRVPTMYDEYFYSCDDAKAIAPYERKIAALRAEFCRFAWDSDEDSQAVPVVATTGPVHDTPAERHLATKLIKTRLRASKGDLFNRSGRLVNLDQLFQSKNLIAFARRNKPLRGGASLWSERDVLVWLSGESYRWSLDSTTSDDSCDNAKPPQLDDVWKRTPAAG